MLDSVTVVCGEAWARMVRSEQIMNACNGTMQQEWKRMLGILPDYFSVWPHAEVKFEAN